MPHPDARILENWIEALAKRVGRSAQSIKDDGCLDLADFHHKVSIQYLDGSSVIFRDALALVSLSRQQVGVFTRHCGYLQFPLVLGMDVIESDVVSGERVISRRYVHKPETQTAS